MKRTLMIQGATSDAGKSLLVAGLCRYFSSKGKAVAPFKPQNMALNSAVTPAGGEIGRAQALQALAAGIQPHTDMNPVLLKPASEIGAQIIINGQPQGNMNAKAYHQFKPQVLGPILAAYDRLANEYELILVEGAGSPAEINLRDGDVANMGFAEAVDCPVVLVADIERGGVFAHLFGTLALLSASEQQRIVGFVINRFRGDLEILKPGLDWLEEKTGKPVLGVIPYLPNLMLDGEDSVSLKCVPKVNQGSQAQILSVAVIRLPSMSNDTDFDPLIAHPNVQLTFVEVFEVLPACDLIILPGSKSVRADLNTLYNHQWEQKIRRHLRYGGKLLGVCGGYQMLGEYILDPLGIEGALSGESVGFGLLPIRTQLACQKQLAQVQAELIISRQSVSIQGYEIHHGCTEVTDSSVQQPIRYLDGHFDGVISEDERILGTYLHGLFDTPDACRLLLDWAGLSVKCSVDYNQIRDQQLNRLSDAIAQALDLGNIENPLFRALRLDS